MKDIVVRLTQEVYDELQRIAERKGISLEQVLADAVDLEFTLADIKRDGGRLLVEKEGHVQELLTARR